MLRELPLVGELPGLGEGPVTIVVPVGGGGLAAGAGLAASVLDRHASDPRCSGCHERVDPIGLGLEMYDAIGSLRPFDPAELGGRRTYVAGLEREDFLGGAELGAIVRGSAMAEACVVEQVARWASGHRLGDEDACWLEDLRARFAGSGGSFRELVIALVTSEPFRHLPAPEDAGCP